MKPKQSGNTNADLGFQIAPMIDVVFVILVFFMVLAGQARVEYELKIKLPGDPFETSEAMAEMPDELTIAIADNGQVSINDAEVDKADSQRLPELFTQLNLIRKNAESGKTKLLVTVNSEETAKCERIALVLDTLTAAGASENVTFSVGDGE